MQSLARFLHDTTYEKDIVGSSNRVTFICKFWASMGSGDNTIIVEVYTSIGCMS